MKSTHQGSCQACGRVQRLPDGRLAKHGYAVEWGAFHGVCPGSGELPFEQSCALVARYVAGARERLAQAVRFRRSLLAPVAADATRGWYHVYYSHDAQRRHGGYQWTEVEFVWILRGTSGYKHPVTGKVERTYAGGIYSDDLAEHIAYYNRRYAHKQAAHTVHELILYIRWQQRRIDTWTPQPLLPAVAQAKQMHTDIPYVKG